MPVATLGLIAVSIVLHAIGWSPDLDDLAWPVAAVVSLFIGGGFVALVVNLLFLWLFAKSLEDALGSLRMLCLFALAGLAAAGLADAVDADTSVPSVGVAGAIAGLIGAHVTLFPRAKILCWVLIPFFVTFVEIPAVICGAVWFALQALDAFGQPPIAGLLGGLGLGIAAAAVVRRSRWIPTCAQPS